MCTDMCATAARMSSARSITMRSCVVWTGSFETLASMVKVAGHVTAYELRQFQRFASIGPWPH
eukprot:4312117-Prymnesium_polylepis.1